jgi:hypothetical protein
MLIGLIVAVALAALFSNVKIVTLPSNVERRFYSP